MLLLNIEWQQVTIDNIATQPFDLNLIACLDWEKKKGLDIHSCSASHQILWWYKEQAKAEDTIHLHLQCNGVKRRRPTASEHREDDYR